MVPISSPYRTLTSPPPSHNQRLILVLVFLSCTVYTFSTSNHTHIHMTTSGWLSPDDDELGYIGRIDQRIEAVTGLTMSTAEQLQVSFLISNVFNISSVTSV